jgi:Kef-type K+ transport system membrane component KefB
MSQEVTAGGITVDIVHPSRTVLYAVGQLGLVLTMFLVGTQVDTRLLRHNARSAGWVSAMGITAPVIAGGAAGIALAGDDRLFPDDTSAAQSALFLASAMAVTAFPVLARILVETGQAGTRIGTLAISAAAFDDAVAWTLLALTLALAQGSSADAAVTLVGAALYAVGMATLGRRALARLRIGPERSLTPARLAVVLVVVMGCAALTERIGVHAVFGAFIAGAAMPRGAIPVRLMEALEQCTTVLLLPVFFVYAGLNTKVGLLREGTLLWLALGLIVLAFVSKGGGCTVAMRLSGASWRSSAALGSLMNARGLMELTLITIGLEFGLITPSLYAILALVAIITTMAAPPLFLWLERVEEPANRMDGGRRRNGPSAGVEPAGLTEQ